jgi:hypothetical protein
LIASADGLLRAHGCEEAVGDRTGAHGAQDCE